MNLRRTLLAVTSLALGLAGISAGPSGQSLAAEAPVAPLTNLAHLDWLGDTVDPPDQAGHTTYRLAEEPELGVLWTYAEPRNGVLTRVGGGTYDPATNTYSQGAFNADDVSRAAVVYVRHWVATGSTSSRHKAYQLLRGLTYMQTATGTNAGNVVLWMQPDGTLNRSAIPVELPDPSDSDASYWLARTIWALGEGYAAFTSTADPADDAFAAFLRDRMELAVAAIDRQVLNTYGQLMLVDGRPTPSWLIADGADASAEAVLGLAAYKQAGGSAAARAALNKLADGIARLSDGTARTWPFGAVYPWALSRSVWHAWGSQMPAALARAAQTLGTGRYLAAAVKDSAVFTPWMLTSGGPDNGRLPTRLDQSQIAYGADSRVQSLLATADVTHKVGFRRLAAMQAAWFFGANPAGVPAYDPATGRTIDGISGDGVVNTNSGAESTIHGLLTMLALDAHPYVARAAQATATIAARVGTTTIQAEDASTTGPAHVVTLADRWTGESLFGGSGYLAMGDGATATLTAPPADGKRLVMPVVDLMPGSSAVTTWSIPDKALGSIASGNIGPQGASPAPGALLPVTLPKLIGQQATTLRVAATATGGDEARLDAVMLEPVVSRYVLSGHGHATALLRSAGSKVMRTVVLLPGSGPTRVEVYDGKANLLSRWTTKARTVQVPVKPGGFSIVLR